MRGAKGYLIITDPDPHRGAGGVAHWERDTYTCNHCNTVHTVKPMCDSGEAPARCLMCDCLICHGCVGQGCTPFEKKLEAYEARERFRNELLGG